MPPVSELLNNTCRIALSLTTVPPFFRLPLSARRSQNALRNAYVQIGSELLSYKFELCGRLFYRCSFMPALGCPTLWLWCPCKNSSGVRYIRCDLPRFRETSVDEQIAALEEQVPRRYVHQVKLYETTLDPMHCF